MGSRLEDILLRMSKLIRNMMNRLGKLESIAHAPRDFVSCEDCKQKIRETDNGTKG